MTSRIKLILGLAATALLTCCSDSFPEISDEQILALFADRPFFASTDASLKISDDTEECIRLISGIDKEIYRDLPQEITDQMGTVCRKDITARLPDPKLNPMRLTLQQVETIAFAERLTRARANAEITVK